MNHEPPRASQLLPRSVGTSHPPPPWTHKTHTNARPLPPPPLKMTYMWPIISRLFCSAQAIWAAHRPLTFKPCTCYMVQFHPFLGGGAFQVIILSLLLLITSERATKMCAPLVRHPTPGTTLTLTYGPYTCRLSTARRRTTEQHTARAACCKNLARHPHPVWHHSPVVRAPPGSPQLCAP
jgi:hypothetical protein